MPKVRTFIAVELPERVRADVSGLQKDLAASGLKLRWVQPQNMHLTLKFLGDVERGSIGDICTCVAAAAHRCPAFDLVPGGVGCFPGVKNPRVVWVGISGELGSLRSLQADVENALSPLGFKPEKRPYRGHLTIGRVKARPHPHKLAAALRNHLEFGSEGFTVDHVGVFQSVLQPEGPTYTRLCHLPLA